MVEYYLRRVGPDFEVAKFEDSAAPTKIYRIEVHGHSIKCDCESWTLGRRRPCKHQLMLAKWLAAGEPSEVQYAE